MKKFILFIVLTVTSFIMFNSASASEIAKSGDNVVVDGDYSSLRLIAGNKVNNKSINDGLSVMAANELLLEGESTYGFYAGQNITVRETILKDLFIAGKNISFDEANIGRDLYVTGGKVNLKATVGRNVFAATDIIDLSDATIYGDIYIDANTVILNKNTEINGILNYSVESKIEGLSEASVSDVKTHIKPKHEDISAIDYITEGIIGFIGKFILLVVILLLLPTFKEELDVEDLAISNICKNVGIGFTLLIMVPILCLFGMITVILIPISILVLIFYVIAIYLSYLFVSYVFGNMVTTKVFQKDNLYLKAFVGLIISGIITKIPYVGGLIVFLMILFGIGHYIKLFKK